MKPFSRQKSSGILIGLAVILNLIVLIAGLVIYRGQKKILTSNVSENLALIADLKINSIQEWMEQREQTLFSIAGNPFFYQYYLKYLETGSDHYKAELGSWLESLLKDENFDQVILCNERRESLLSFPVFQPLLTRDTWMRVKELMDQDPLHFLDLYKGAYNDLHMGFVVNISDSTNPQLPACHLFVRINPEHYFYPYLQERPGNSESAETLLGRIDGDSVVYVNRLKYNPEAPLNLKMSLSDSSVALVKGARGFVGVTEALDYRGIKVMAAVRKVPGTSWIMVARQDREEVFQSLRGRLLFLILGLVGVMILISGSILWIFRQQGMRFYRQAYLSEKERNWLYDLIEQSLNEIYVFRADNLQFTYVNKGGRNNLGYTMDELLAMTPVSIKPLVNQEQFEKLIEPLRSGETKIQRFTTVHQRKNGTEYPVEVFLQLMDSAQGLVFLAVINDITSRLDSEKLVNYQQEELALKNAELEILNQELQEKNKELQITNREIIRAKEVAEQANHLKSRFLANMSHEIRTPLNGILGFAELLHESAENEEHARMAEIIMSGGTRLLDTVNSVLDISSLESGNLAISLKKTDLLAVTQESCSLYAAMASKKNLALQNEVMPGSFVLADETLTLKIINNLINNALKFTEKGLIKIAANRMVRNGQTFLGIEVTDTGIGIPSRDLEIIFEEFRQSSEGLSKKHKGSGLGLYISKGFSQAMHGWISAKSTQGEGSSFTLWLPEYSE